MPFMLSVCNKLLVSPSVPQLTQADQSSFDTPAYFATELRVFSGVLSIAAACTCAEKIAIITIKYFLRLILILRF